MKIKNLLLGATALAITFASCSSDEKPVGYDHGSIVFKTTIDDKAPGNETKASRATWDAGNNIGLFMKRNAGLTTIMEGAANKKFTTLTAAGNFTPATATDAILYPADGNPVDFIAYYPHTTTLTSSYVYKVNVASQTSQEAIDLLYSDNAKNIATNVSTVPLNFTHQLAKVAFTFNQGPGTSTLTSMTVKLQGANTTADFDLGTAATSKEGGAADIALKAGVNSGAQAVFEAILLPANVTSAYKIVCQLTDGKVYTYTFPTGTVFEKGKENTFTTPINEGSSTGVFPAGNITDWGQGSSQNVELDPEPGVPTPGDGTKANPYTIADIVAAKVGETGKWVEGFIVGSTATPKVGGAPTKLNILIAATATETDESKCIAVDLIGSAVQDNLDIAANPTLIGKKVKLQADIVTAFSGLTSLGNVVAQEGGATVTPPEPQPTGSLVFAGADFEDWSAFLAGLTTHGLKPGYTTQSTNGRNGTSALYMNGSPTANDYVFTATNPAAITSLPTKIVFYIKGTSAKSLSLNIFRTDGLAYDVFNLGDYSNEAVLQPANIQANTGNGTNSYAGTINTGGAWMKVTLDISTLSISKAAGQSILALKVGSKSAYDLLVDDITFE